jgi:hypothetical protein
MREDERKFHFSAVVGFAASFSAASFWAVPARLPKDPEGDVLKEIGRIAGEICTSCPRPQNR